VFEHPHSTDEPSSKIVTIDTHLDERLALGGVSSPMLTTLEDIFFSVFDPIDIDESLVFNLATLGKSF
jgi:hypothetical protein